MNQLRIFKRDTAGVAAIEAALILPAFIGLLVFGLEFMAFAFSTRQLDHAVVSAVQEIRLHESSRIARAKNWTAEEYYRETICSKVFSKNCIELINVDIKQYDDDANFENSTNDQFISETKLIHLNVELPFNASVIMKNYIGSPIIMKSGMVVLTEPI
ncbi:MAG: TadE family protein [Pseudomonadota bacterium]